MENKKGTNVLGAIFDWLGEVFERFNPSAFRFLAAFLPYLTPFPVASLTATSAEKFLQFTPAASFIFVFALEGIGLWFTSMLVDASVGWIRSRNWRAFFPVLLFGAAVYGYVTILVTLNVTLEQAIGNTNEHLSLIIRLLCYLPLITGIGNGYYKLQLDYKKERRETLEHTETREDILRREANEAEERKRKEEMEYEKERLRIQEEQKTARAKAKLEALALQKVYEQQTTQEENRTINKTVASQYKDDIISVLNDTYRDLGKVLSVKQIADHFGLDYERNKGYISTLRKNWAASKNITLTKKKVQ